MVQVTDPCEPKNKTSGPVGIRFFRFVFVRVRIPGKRHPLHPVVAAPEKGETDP